MTLSEKLRELGQVPDELIDEVRALERELLRLEQGARQANENALACRQTITYLEARTRAAMVLSEQLARWAAGDRLEEIGAKPEAPPQEGG